MSIYETAVMVNELYQDYNPYDLEDDMPQADEIAEIIAAKDYCLPQELMEMAIECSGGYEEMKEKVLNVFNEVMKHY